LVVLPVVFVATGIAAGRMQAQVTREAADLATADSPIRRFADSPKLYITNQGGASITVVDQTRLAVDTVIDLTTLGFTPNAKPHHTVVEKDGSFWYATLIGDGRVLKFDRANRLVAQVPMETPGLLALDPAHDSLYVGRSMTAVNPPKSLGVIKRSTFTMVEEQEIEIPRPHALAASRDGKWVHVASLAENRFASLETATGRVTHTTLPGAMRSMVQFTVSPDGKRLVVGGELSNSVMVFDITKAPPYAPVAEFTLSGKPWDPVFSRDGKRAWFSQFGGNSVSEVDLASGKIVRTISGHIAQPYDMILRADGKYLFVVNQNIGATKPGASAHDNMPGMSSPSAPAAPATGWLSVINVATGKVEKELPLGKSPSGMGAAGAR
jgi:DNA-binding beta-propeller fold protein YncE